MNARELRREAMRIGGESVHRDRVIEVFNPYTEQLIGTVPKATVEDVKRAFAIARGFKSKLTRFDRAAVLNKAAAIVCNRTAELSDLITAESGLCKKDSLYEIGRVSDVVVRRQRMPQGRRPDLFLRLHTARQEAPRVHPATCCSASARSRRSTTR
jgi:acyl-CoA reductase-like NAD-dependent aldehyde dehydrogenase